MLSWMSVLLGRWAEELWLIFVEGLAAPCDRVGFQHQAAGRVSNPGDTGFRVTHFRMKKAG